MCLSVWRVGFALSEPCSWGLTAGWRLRAGIPEVGGAVQGGRFLEPCRGFCSRGGFYLSERFYEVVDYNYDIQSSVNREDGGGHCVAKVLALESW